MVSLLVLGGCVTKQPQNLRPIPPLPPIHYVPKPPPLPPMPTPTPKKALLLAAKPVVKSYTFTNVFVGTTNILTNCISPTTVVLGWCPSSSATNEWIGYRIYWGSGAVPDGWTPTVYGSGTNCPPIIISTGTNWFRSYTNVVDVGTNLTATITNLATGAAYFFTSTAYDTNGLESDYSDEIVFTNITLIRPPFNFTVTIRPINGGILLQTKLCPFSLVSVWYKNTLMEPSWSLLSSNLTTDLYGNFFYTDATTNPSRFYRLQLQ